MRRQLPSALLLAALAATAARGENAIGNEKRDAGGETARAGALQGRVSTQGRAATEAAPLARATVYAYELAKLQIHKVVSGQQGDFRFEQLPAGVYKLIAFKVGYEPGVVMLSRAAAGALQFVDLRLALEQSRGEQPSESFWAIRDQIPPDVLRDIEVVRLTEQVVVPGTRLDVPDRGFRAALHAMTGVQELGAAQTMQLAGAGIGMEGRIGSLDVGVTGDFWRSDSAASAAVDASGSQATALEVRMAGSGEGLIDFTTVSHRGSGARTARGEVTGVADFERYRVSWMQPFGERSSSRFEAQYTSQNNFFAQPAFEGLNDTRALNVEGAYMLATERNSLETGVRYREQMAGHTLAGGVQAADRALELFGKGGVQLQPSVLVEYGMFTQLRDGSLALAPQGGVVVQLGSQWQALASGSYRLDSGDARPLGGFTPIRFSQADGTCRDLEQHCYRVMLSRQGEDGQILAIGGVHRELAETLHLYFQDDFLNRLEGLHLVQGDRVPEVQLIVERRLAPRVLARLESSYGAGGGGILYAVGDKPHENRVRYLVTSLDTRFQASKTGVFVAFHQLEQGAEALSGAAAEPVTASELERLQLMLSQDLELLARVAADWAVHVNFEVSRGELPFSPRDAPADELRRQVTGGLSIKF